MTHTDSEASELLGRCERVVALALTKGAAEAEAFWSRSRSLALDIEKGRLANTALHRDGGGSVRIIRDGRLGFAYFSSEKEAASAIDASLRLSRHGEENGYHLPEARHPVPVPGRFDSRIAALDVADAQGLVADLVAGATETCPKGVVSGGGVGLASSSIAIASSRGVALHDASTSVEVGASVVLEGDVAVSASRSAAAHRWELDAHDVGAEAGRTTASLANPGPVARGGRFDVLFRPEISAELVVDFMANAVLGNEALRGKTMWSGRLGQPVAAQHLNLVDDSHDPRAVDGVPFDDEGVPVARLPIVEAGVLRSFLFNTWDAHIHGQTSTASGVRSDSSSRPGTGTHHLILEGRNRPMDKLIAGIDDGFLVDSVLGAHTANPTTGEFSVTAPNVWRIRKGAIAGPCREIAIAGTIPDMLGAIEAVSTEAKAMQGLRVPSIHVSSLDVSV